MSEPDPVVILSSDPREVRVAELETQLRQRDALIAQLQQPLAELKQRSGRAGACGQASSDAIRAEAPERETPTTGAQSWTRPVQVSRPTDSSASH